MILDEWIIIGYLIKNSLMEVYKTAEVNPTWVGERVDLFSKNLISHISWRRIVMI